jgi:DNA-binding CsgD family transcriptional regulator
MMSASTEMSRRPDGEERAAAGNATSIGVERETRIVESHERARDAIRRSRELREAAARARAARGTPPLRNAPSRDPIEALQLVAERLLVLTREAEQRSRERTRAELMPVESPLTRRQIEILGLIAEGLSTENIAGRLWLSPVTVRNHAARILRALDAHSRVEAVAKARRLGLLE